MFTQEAELLYEVEVPGPPVVMQLYDKTGGQFTISFNY